MHDSAILRSSQISDYLVPFRTLQVGTDKSALATWSGIHCDGRRAVSVSPLTRFERVNLTSLSK
jgi:hypothetical protein